MNYFQQIIFNNESNLKLLLGDKSGKSLSDSEKKILFKNHVEIINLELSYQCNRKCDYCPVSSSNRQKEQRYIDNILLTKICNELAEIRYENRISLNLYNEPLMDENLEQKISFIKDKLPYAHLAFNTNGDYLNFDRFKSLAESGIDNICVTLHAPPNKIQSRNTIAKRIVHLFKKLNYALHDNVSIENHVKESSFIQLSLLGVRLKIQWPDWRIEGTNRAGVLQHHKYNQVSRKSPCVKPFREFTIFYDGNVQPCCEAFHDDKVNLAQIGNINTSTIFNIYMTDKLSKFRYALFDFSEKKGICANCTVNDFSSKDEDQERKNILKKVSTIHQFEALLVEGK